MPTDFWGPMSEPAFTGPGIAPDNAKAEGPSVVRTDAGWLIYCDYWKARKNGMFFAQDFKTMTRLHDQFQAPVWVRHGTVLRVPRATVETLKTL